MRKAQPSREQQAFLEEVAALWPLAKGSLAEVRKPCIRPHCAACRSGRKHPAWLFTFTQDGKRRCRYVPAEGAPALQRALLNGRQLEKRLVELGVEWLERYRQERR